MHPWVIYALLSALFAAAVAILGKIGIKDVDPTLATTIRAIIMASFFIIVSFALNKFSNATSIDRRSLLFIALSGLAGALSWLWYFLALRYGPASGVASLDRLSVVLVFILAIIFLGEKFTWVSALGATLVVLGGILMVVR